MKISSCLGSRSKVNPRKTQGACYHLAMDEFDRYLAWTKPSSDAVGDLYTSSLNVFTRRFSGQSEEEQASEIVAYIFRVLSGIISVYGLEGEQDNIAVKCQPPKETGGIWTFDVRFSINGRNSQVLAAARDIKEIAESLNKEINVILRSDPEISR